MNIVNPRAATAELTSGDDTVQTAVYVLDVAGGIVWTPPGGSSLFAMDPASVAKGAPFLSLWSPSDRAAVERGLAAAVQFGQARVSGAALSGAHLTASIDARRGADGEVTELLATIAAAGAGRALFDALPVVMWKTLDRDAYVIVGNPESERRYGFSAGSNQSLSQPKHVVHDNYRYYRDGREVPAARLPMQRAVKGEDVRDEEYEVRFRDGRIAHVILSASPMRDAAGRVDGCVCVEIDITERKLVERAQRRLLECSRETGPAFFESLVCAVAETLDACHVYIAQTNPAGSNELLHPLAAWSRGALTGQPDSTPIRTPCADVIAGATKIVPRNVQGVYPEATVPRELDAQSYVGTPLRAADGEVIGLIGVLLLKPLSDVKRPAQIVELFAARAQAELERQRAEASLRKSEQDYRTVADAIPALILRLDNKARFQFVNAALATWFGINADEAKGRHLSDVIGAAAFAKIEGRIKGALGGERQKFELHMPYARGGNRHVSAEYVPYIEDNEVRGLFALVTDISEQKSSADTLREREAQFRTLFAHLPVGAALINRQGRVLLENDVFNRLLPASPRDDAAQASVFDRACTLCAPSGAPLRAAEHPARQALRGAVSRDVELVSRYGNGGDKWVRMSGIPVLNEGGVVTGALVVVADIHSERLADDRRSLLINELNHRVKNTLASVQSIASQTFRTSELTRDGLAAFEDRILALSHVHNLLTQEHWEGADLKRLSELVLEPHNPGGNRLRVDGPSVRLKPPAALAFAMALHELATNAVKYGALSTPSGDVSLTWHVVGADETRTFRFAWREQGGPTVVVPTRKGFGTRLIERSLAFELSSATSIRFEPVGVVCEIEADLRDIAG